MKYVFVDFDSCSVRSFYFPCLSVSPSIASAISSLCKEMIYRVVVEEEGGGGGAGAEEEEEEEEEEGGGGGGETEEEDGGGGAAAEEEEEEGKIVISLFSHD